MTSVGKKNWTFWKGILVLMLSFLLFSIGVILLSNVHYDKAIGIFSSAWGGMTVVFGAFGMRKKAREEISLSELFDLWPVRVLIIFWAPLSVTFLILISMPVHLVILRADTFPDNARDSVFVKWDGHAKGPTDTMGQVKFRATIGPHLLSYKRKDLVEKYDTVNISLENLFNTLEWPLEYEADDSVRGHLYISSRPDGAEIWLNGKNTGKKTNDYVHDHPVGRWHIELRKSRYHTKIGTVEVKAGKTEPFCENLHILAGSLEITDTSGAFIYLNGKWLRDKRTPQDLVLPIGKYVLELRKREGKYGWRWKKSIEITVNTTLLIDIELDNKKFQRQNVERLHSLYIMSDPAADILVDGRPAGKKTNSDQIYLFAGMHNVTLKEDGYDDYSFPVKVPDVYVLSDTIKLQKRLGK